MRNIKTWTASLAIGLFALGPGLAAAHAAFSIDVRTTASDTADTAADRLYVITNAAQVKAPTGTRMWVVIDKNGDGLPAKPEPGNILGPDDILVLEDVVPGQLPAVFSGRYIRNGLPVADESLRNRTNAYVLLWEFFAPLAEVPNYTPAAGTRYDLKKLAATSVPDVGNAKFRIFTDVVTTNVLGQTPPTPPTISTHPQKQQVKVGDPVTFTVVAAGSPPLAYQWKKNDVDLPGATGVSYTIAAAQPSDAGTYRVVVSNTLGNTASDPAVLTVLEPPSITQQPQPQTVDQGQPASFSVTATGTPPLAYQWQKDGIDLPGNTEPVLQIPSAQPSDQGLYTVRVTNPGGQTSSNEALLTVRTTAEPVRIEGVALAEELGNRIFSFGFATQAGRTYQIQSTTSLTPFPPPWVNQGNPIAGTGTSHRFAENLGDLTEPPPVKFYRLLVQ